MDESWLGNLGKACMNGLICAVSFASISNTTNMYDELAITCQGAMIANELGDIKIELEIDSSQVMNLIN